MAEQQIKHDQISAKIDFRNISKQIRSELDKLGIGYEYLTHRPTPTSQDSADVRGVDISLGVKALIIQGKQSKNLTMCCLPANYRLSLSKLAEILGEKCSMADKDLVESLGLQIGGIPPLGHLIGIKTIYDESVLKMNDVWFNCGTQTESIKMSAADLAAHSRAETRDIKQV